MTSRDKARQRSILVNATARRLMDNHQKPGDTLTDHVVYAAIEGEVMSWCRNGYISTYYAELSDRGAKRLMKDVRKALAARAGDED